MKKIVVVGSFVMDLIATIKDFPKEGQTIIGDTFNCMPGGKGANQAVAAARLGGKVQMFGKLGNDSYGHTFVNLFHDEKIDISHVKMHDELPTALGLIQINQHAENKIVVVPGANFGYTNEELQSDFNKILDADIVITQLELKHDVTYQLIDLCHINKIPVILNPAPAIEIPEEILRKVTYLTPNETELEILTGIKIVTLDDAERAISTLLKIGVKNVVATLGKNGALIGNQDGFQYVKGFEVEAIDTVAAGDAFNGALAYGIVNELSLYEAVSLANMVGALTVTKCGAIPSIPRKLDIELFSQGL